MLASLTALLRGRLDLRGGLARCRLCFIATRHLVFGAHGLAIALCWPCADHVARRWPADASPAPPTKETP